MDIIKNLKNNWKSGITVSLVSIPLSVSLAVASQTTPVVGIITAIWAGLISSIFGGSNFNIVGPTGALSGILATYAIANGAPALPMLAIMSGLIILAAYTLRLEKYLVFVPASTVHGFTLGVAFIISLNQLNALLGITGVPAHEKLVQNVAESFNNLDRINPAAIVVFVIFLVGLILMRMYVKKVPGAIVLAPLGILLGFLTSQNYLPLNLQTLGMKYSDLNPILFTKWEFSFTPTLIATSLVVAFVAILETMISARIADGMTKTKHNKRKEMMGLGMANIVSGMFGGIPATAALARTSLNIKSGADNKLSATISSIGVALISFIFLTYFRFIPMAVIAAILVNVAINMIELHHFRVMYHHDKKAFILALIVGFVTVCFDPTLGILLGVAVALLIFVEKLSHGQFELTVNDTNKKMTHKLVNEGSGSHDIKIKAHTLVYSFKGQLAYINGQSHLMRFEKGFSKDYDNLILRMRELYFIDLDGIEVLEEIIELAEHAGKKVIITGVNEMISSLLENSKSFKKLEKSGQIFDKTSDALRKLGYKI